jgi:taurine transport system permease protein
MSDLANSTRLSDLAPETGKGTAGTRVLLSAGPVRVVTVLALLLVWSIATYFEWLPAFYLPSPRAVLDQLYTVTTDGYADATLLQHLEASLWRILAALLIAFITAVPAGVAIGLSPIARGILDPIIEFLRPVPPLAYLPLVVIWCGIGETTKVLIILIAIFAPVAITTAAGVAAVPTDRLDAARALGASKWQVLWHVILPNSLPSILTGVRIGLGVGWSTLIAAELVAASRGLGIMIKTASDFLQTDIVVLGIFVIALVAIGFEWIVRSVEKILVPWHGKA